MGLAEGQRRSPVRHPTLDYSLLAVLGVYGVYVSMPIFYHPQSTLEWVDLAINLAIFIPCSFIAVVGALLATFSAVFSYKMDEEGRFATFAHSVLKAFGVPGLLLREFVALSPLGLLGAILTRRYSGRSISATSIPRPDGDTQQ